MLLITEPMIILQNHSEQVNFWPGYGHALRHSHGDEENPVLVFGSLTIDLSNHTATKNNDNFKTTTTEFSLAGSTGKKFRKSIDSSEYSKRNLGIWIYWSDTISESICRPASQKNRR